MNIPRIDNLAEAVSIYYSHEEIGIAEIQKIFGCCRGKASALKKIASEYIVANGTMLRSSRYVDTELAFIAWGISIEDVEWRVKHLKDFNDHLKN